MTLAESSHLTPEQLRVVVAERLGWRYPGSTSLKLESWGRWIPPKGSKTKRVPNYPEDLNACASFETTLTDDQQEEYAHILSQLVPQKMNCGPVEDDGPDIMVHREFDLLSAKGELRCRAFLAVTEVTETGNE